MLLCYLAVQRYNFFLENKIFPHIISSERPQTNKNCPTLAGWAAYFYAQTALFDQCTHKCTLEIGVGNATSLLRVNLQMGSR